MSSGIQVVVKDALPEDVNIRNILRIVFASIPQSYLEYVDALYVGQFESLSDKDFAAMYSQGAIYLNNVQVSEEDASSHIIHEFGHALEKNNSSVIYSDGLIEREFIAKRERVHSLLLAEGIDVPLSYVYDVEYNVEFDSILYNEVGYPMLTMLTTNIFYSPYFMTSINEYFAGTFEVFYGKRDVSFVKQVSPSVYEKIIELEVD